MATQYIRYPGVRLNPSSFPLLAPDGSSTAPSYSFASDPDTGMYLAGANDLAFAAGGTKIVDILTTGMTVAGLVTANSFIPTSSSAPTNGMYLSAANNVAISANSTPVLRFSYSGGSVITFLNSTSAQGAFFNNGNTDSLMSFSGDTGSGSGRNLRLFGGSHASTPNLLEARRATTVDFSINGSGLVTLGNSGSTQTHVANGSFTATVSGSQLLRSESTNSTGESALDLRVASGNTTGDVYALFRVTSGQSWAVGLDNSDSDAWKVSSSTTLGTNDYLQVSTGGLVTMGASGGTQRHRINAGAATNGAVALTLLNGPTGTTGNPTYWIQLNFNGTNIVIPAWIGV